MKVLVIEDSKTSAAMVCNQIAAMGLTPISAHDGESGIALYREHRPDLVLLDVVLPGADGYQVAEAIRAVEKEGEWTPITFLTARTRDEDLERGIAAGGDDYLTKPVSEMVLKAKVRAMQRIAQMRSSLVDVTRRLDEANRELTRLSSVDGLTGIANRRRFDEMLHKEWRRSQRRGLPLALLLCDVDFFKQYNDAHGHQAGDECLKMVAKALEGRLQRSADLAARYGGEEFGVILPETDLGGAALVAEALRRAVADLGIAHSRSSAGVVTISAGVAALVPQASFGAEKLLDAADRALYEAKRQGRDRIHVAAPEDDAAGS